MGKISLHRVFSSPVGKMTVFLVILICGVGLLVLVQIYREPVKEAPKNALHKAEEFIYEAKVSEYDDRKSPEIQIPAPPPEKKTVKEQPKEKRNPVPVRTNSDKVIVTPSSGRGQRASSGRRVVREAVLPLCLYQKTTVKESTTVSDEVDIAPYGRLLRCELAKSISTSSLETPLIALVTEPLYWDGVEIIPAGVEVHGRVSGNPYRDRIGTSNSWTVVYPFRDHRSAYQLQLTGIALDCNRSDHMYGKSDGTAGIRGIVRSNADSAKMAGYIASFISGLGSGLVTQNNTYTGGSTLQTSGGTWKDAIGKALETSAEKIATDLLTEAAKEVTYVEAEAGTEFYIYITEIIDPAKAARGKMPAKGILTKSQGNPDSDSFDTNTQSSGESKVYARKVKAPK